MCRRWTRPRNRYLLDAIFRDTWGERLRPYLSDDDYAELVRVCDPRHSQFALRRPDFHFLQSFTLVTGEANLKPYKVLLGLRPPPKGDSPGAARMRRALTRLAEGGPFRLVCRVRLRGRQFRNQGGFRQRPEERAITGALRRKEYNGDNLERGGGEPIGGSSQVDLEFL